MSFSMGIFIFDKSIKTLFRFLDKEHIFPFSNCSRFFLNKKKSHQKQNIRSHARSRNGNYKVPVDCKISSWLALPQNCTQTQLHTCIRHAHTLQLHFHNRVGRGGCLAQQPCSRFRKQGLLLVGFRLEIRIVCG